VVVTVILSVVVGLLVGVAIGAGGRLVAGRRTRAKGPTPSDLQEAGPTPSDLQEAPDLREAGPTPSDLQEAPDLRGAPASTEAGPASAPAGPASDRDHDRRTLDALWQLQRLELQAARRRDAGLSTAAGSDDGPVGLADAVRQEITRIREEIGTPGGFRSDLRAEPDPAAALLLLRSLQSMLDLVARRSQAFDLHLEGGEPALAVTVLCDDFDGDGTDIGAAGAGLDPAALDPAALDPAALDPAAFDATAFAATDPEASALAGAIGPAGGTLVFGRSADGRVCAHLRVPTT
jgi:hypothetical protein